MPEESGHYSHQVAYILLQIRASDRQEFRKKVYEFGGFFDSWEKRLLKAKKAWLSNLTSN